MNQILDILYNYTVLEYIYASLLVFSIPLLFLILSRVASKQYSFREFLMSLTIPLSAILFLATQVVVQIVTGTKFSFDYQFVFIFLFVNFSLLFFISLNLKNVLSFLVLVFCLLIMYLPIAYTNFVFLNSVVIFVVSLILSVLILCIPLRKYYAKK